MSCKSTIDLKVIRGKRGHPGNNNLKTNDYSSDHTLTPDQSLVIFTETGAAQLSVIFPPQSSGVCKGKQYILSIMNLASSVVPITSVLLTSPDVPIIINNNLSTANTSVIITVGPNYNFTFVNCIILGVKYWAMINTSV